MNWGDRALVAFYFGLLAFYIRCEFYQMGIDPVCVHARAVNDHIIGEQEKKK